MLSIQPIRSLEQLKILADPRRLAILQLLMSGPASLTSLGKDLGKHPAWVRHHIKQLEIAGLVTCCDAQGQSGVVEKLYSVANGGILVQQLILPDNPAQPVVVFTGDADLAVEYLARQMSHEIDLLVLTLSSLDGLVALRQGLCTIAGVDLPDLSGEYNLPYIRAIFTDRPMRVITLAEREQGFITAPGNPRAIHSPEDLARAEVTWFTSSPGSGARLWLDQKINALGSTSKQFRPYPHPIATPSGMARLIRSSKADGTVGLRATARQFGLEFIPQFTDRYDLVFPEEQAKLLSPLIDALQNPAIKMGLEAETGYRTTHTGEVRPL